MATIILKGTDRKIECTLSQCENINKLKEQKKDPKTPLNISGIVLELGEIRYAIPDGEKDREMKSEERKEDNQKYLAELSEEYKNTIRELCNQSPEKKAKNVSHAKMMWQGFNDELVAPQSFLDEVEKRQLDYFKQHQNLPYANPICYRDLLTVSNQEENTSWGEQKKFMRNSMIKLVYRTLQEAFNTARNL